MNELIAFDLTPKQRKASLAVEHALNAAHKAGLILRVFEGTVYLAPPSALDHPLAHQPGWMEMLHVVDTKINADGGAGW